MPVVTISGQIGSAAREVGRATAHRLQIDYVDQEILVEAARELGVPMESVVSHDERTAGLGERLANMFRRFMERSAAAGTGDPLWGTAGLDLVLSRTYGEAAEGEGLPEVSDDRYIETLTAIVKGIAKQDNVLIIGRGSQVILADRPNVVHILLTAPLDARVAFITQRDRMTQEDALKRIHEGDKGRVSFHQKFFKIDVDDAALYHLAINTGRYSVDEAAEMIAAAAHRVTAPAPA